MSPATGAAPRWTELLLLMLAAGIGLAAALPRAVTSGGPTPSVAVSELAPTVTLILVLLLAHFALVLWGRGADQVVLPLVACLMLLSLALVQRLAPALAMRQWLWLLLAVPTLVLAALLPFDLRLLRRYRYTWALAGIGLVALTLIAGRAASPGGPRLWLGVGGLSFQPAEVLKLLLVVFLAGYLEDKRELLSQATTRVGPLRLPPLPYLVPLLVMLGLSLVLLAVQGDLGAALLLFAISLGLLYLASSRPAYLVVGLALFLAGAWILHDHVAVVATRASIWRDPWTDPQGAGYQLVQSLMAMSAGGVLGTGIGLGLPTAIPAVHTDFVYAAIVEEIGLAGAAAVVLVYLVLSMRGFRIALEAVETFARLLAAGLTLAIAVQTLIILGGVLKLIPLTGITLPFLSAGGSSMVISCVAAGLLLRISREPRQTTRRSLP
ncbi:MAG: FtsW/RodA/SpoVE family cell cycle protein [Anaerolineae bacterium]